MFLPPPPFPAPLEPSPPLGPAWMPPPPMKKKKMRLLFPYAAVNRVFGIMDRVWGKAMVGLHVVICIINIIANPLSFYVDGDQGGFWTLVSRVTQFLCYVSTTFIICAFIRYYVRVDGKYHETFEPSPRHLQPAAAAELLQLPPPPPEMDMC